MLETAVTLMVSAGYMTFISAGSIPNRLLALCAAFPSVTLHSTVTDAPGQALMILIPRLHLALWEPKWMSLSLAVVYRQPERYLKTCGPARPRRLKDKAAADPLCDCGDDGKTQAAAVGGGRGPLETRCQPVERFAWHDRAVICHGELARCGQRDVDRGSLSPMTKSVFHEVPAQDGEGVGIKI